MPPSKTQAPAHAKPEPPHRLVGSGLTKDLQQHKGRWVAIFGGAVVAFGDSAGEVMTEAIQKGVTDPTLVRVPRHPERLAFYRSV